jgi:iron(III) transport system substrate-binding protein
MGNKRMKSLTLAACALIVVSLLGCDDATTSHSFQPPVILYTSIDQPVLKPILDEFQRRSGVKVVVLTDTEATKSAGIAARLEAERDKPRADVWWGNEPFHTIRLADADVLSPYQAASAKDIPAKFRDPSNRWVGNGLRARVLACAISTRLSGKSPSMMDLIDPKHRGRVAIARPTAGTTGGHVAALYVTWGQDRFTDFFQRLKANEVKLLGGNGPVAEEVGRGRIAIGLTDNDDIAAVEREGRRLNQELPDQDTVGTLVIPTTVALVKGGPNPDDAKRLIDYLLSAEVEGQLYDAKFIRWSVRGKTRDIKMMDVDYAAAAKVMPEAVETAMKILEGR